MKRGDGSTGVGTCLKSKIWHTLGVAGMISKQIFRVWVMGQMNVVAFKSMSVYIFQRSQK